MVILFQTFLGRFVRLKVQREKVLKCPEDIREWIASCTSNLVMENLHRGDSNERKSRCLEYILEVSGL